MCEKETCKMRTLGRGGGVWEGGKRALEGERFEDLDLLITSLRLQALVLYRQRRGEEDGHGQQIDGVQ